MLKQISIIMDLSQPRKFLPLTLNKWLSHLHKKQYEAVKGSLE